MKAATQKVVAFLFGVKIHILNIGATGAVLLPDFCLTVARKVRCQSGGELIPDLNR